MNRLAITKVALQEKSKKTYLAYIMLNEKREFVDFQVFAPETSLLNNIYIGRVEHIAANINGAFLRIAPKQIVYLPLDELKSPLYVKKLSAKKRLSIGDELVVQVIKDAVKTKEPVVSTKLSIFGKYCVLSSGDTSLGVSKKISKEAHAPLKELLQDKIAAQAQAHGFGMVIRSNAVEASTEALCADLLETMQRFLRLKEKALHQCAFAVLEKSEAAYIQKLKSIDLSLLDAVFTEEEEIYQKIVQTLPYLEEKGILKLYRDDKVSLSVLYNFRASLDKLLEKRVWLKSGANIIIEQLETLTVIDVNSGKNISKNETALFDINKEAAVEIAKQLRLRNISGMILVDFINLKSKAYEKELILYFKEELKKDDIPCSFIDITKLGLVELTRKKTYKSLKEFLKYEKND